ncbi:hypothetical protein MBLNU459_g0233t1 [Dothideomycetes sp. NU459]
MEDSMTDMSPDTVFALPSLSWKHTRNVCNIAVFRTLEADFKEPASFCRFWNAIPRMISPFPDLSVSELNTICTCFAENMFSTTAASKMTSIDKTSSSLSTLDSKGTTTIPNSEKVSTAVKFSIDLSRRKLSTVDTTVKESSNTMIKVSNEIVPPAVNISGAIYNIYYSGCGYTESAANPGNDDYKLPPVATMLAGPLSPAAAIERCVALAYNDEPNPNQYYAVDVHYLSSVHAWECVQYFDPVLGGDYFTVANADVEAAYGYSHAI